MKNYFMYLFTLLLLITGCDKDEKEENKKEDNIGLSQKSVLFDGWGETMTIQTEKEGWWFTAIEVDSIKNEISAEETRLQIAGKELVKQFKWLTIRSSNKKIELTAESNFTNNKRTFKIYMQKGNYYDTIEGIQKEEILIGPNDDEIGLSQKTAEFESEGGSVTIHTEGEYWWLVNIKVDDITTHFDPETEEDGRTKEQTKKCDWLTVHTSLKKIELTAEPNNTGKPRTFKICLEAGNYLGYITGVQKQ